MTTNWNDPEINPLGLTYVTDPNQSKRIKVTVTARALAFFKSSEGKVYLCAFVNEEQRRSVFVATTQGYEEVEDKGTAFTIARMTDEIVGQKR